MTDVKQSTPIGEVARVFPAAIAVFEEYDIDYACKGGRSVAEAARAAGFETGTLLDALKDAVCQPAPEEPGLCDLLHTIVTEHHRFEARRFSALAARFDSPEMASFEAARIRTLLSDLATTVGAHMLREERTLFPHIERLDQHPHRVRAGSITGPMLNEFVEHDVIHERLVKIRELALVLRVKKAAREELLDELDELYRTVHRHMHLENNVVIPRVVDLENRLKKARNAEVAG